MDQDRHRFLIFYEIVYHSKDGSEILKNDSFVHTSNGNKRCREIKKGWEIGIQWKNVSSNWNQIKDVKESYPVQLAEYGTENKILVEPEFAWWINHVLRKQYRIILKTYSKYCQKTNKYGVLIPKTVKQSIQLYKENGDTRWWDTILQEMKNVGPEFEVF